MSLRKEKTLDDLLNEFKKSPEFSQQYRKTKPFYDLIPQIINRRNQLGLSQKDLAIRAKTYQSRISKIESAEHDIRLSTLIEIAEALGMEIQIKLIPIAESITKRIQAYSQKVNSPPIIQDFDLSLSTSKKFSNFQTFEIMREENAKGFSLPI